MNAEQVIISIIILTTFLIFLFQRWWQVISNYLMRYKGKYRLKAHIDRNTNDFPRDVHGHIDTDDIYIDCAMGNQITHYGHGILVAYIPSIGRGHNVLKAIGKEIYGEEIIDNINNDYEQLYRMIENNGIIKEIHETDGEVEFKFHSKYLDKIIKHLKPKTSGSNISPFSSKNLPKLKEKYVIPNDELRVYKEIISSVPKDKLLLISRFTKDFIDKKLSKKPYYKSIDINADMKKKMLKGKDYIHSMGMWEEYCNFLKIELEKKLNED